MSRKRNHHDIELVSPEDVLNFLDSNPNLKKMIQMCTYLKINKEFNVVYTGNKRQLLLDVASHLLELVRKFFPYMSAGGSTSPGSKTEVVIKKEGYYYCIWPYLNIENQYELMLLAVSSFEYYLNQITEYFKQNYNIDLIFFSFGDSDFGFEMLIA